MCLPGELETALFADCNTAVISENQVNNHAIVKDSVHWKEIQNSSSLTIPLYLTLSIIEHVW